MIEASWSDDLRTKVQRRALLLGASPLVAVRRTTPSHSYIRKASGEVGGWNARHATGDRDENFGDSSFSVGDCLMAADGEDVDLNRVVVVNSVKSDVIEREHLSSLLDVLQLDPSCALYSMHEEPIGPKVQTSSLAPLRSLTVNHVRSSLSASEKQCWRAGAIVMEQNPSNVRAAMRSSSFHGWHAHTTVHIRHLVANSPAVSNDVRATSTPATIFGLVDRTVCDWQHSHLSRLRSQYQRVLGEAHVRLQHELTMRNPTRGGRYHHKTTSDLSAPTEPVVNHQPRHRHEGVSAMGNALIAGSATLQEVLGDLWEGNRAGPHHRTGNRSGSRHNSDSHFPADDPSHSLSSAGAFVTYGGSKQDLHAWGRDGYFDRTDPAQGMDAISPQDHHVLPLEQMAAFVTSTAIGDTLRRVFATLGELFVSPTTEPQLEPLHIPFLVDSKVVVSVASVSLGGMRESRRDVASVLLKGTLCTTRELESSPLSPPTTTYSSILNHWTKKRDELELLVSALGDTSAAPIPRSTSQTHGRGRRPIRHSLLSTSQVYQWALTTVSSVVQREPPPVAPTAQRGWSRPYTDDTRDVSSSPFRHPHLPPMSASKASKRQLLVSRFISRQEARHAVLMNIASMITVLVDLHALTDNAREFPHSPRALEEEVTIVALKMASLGEVIQEGGMSPSSPSGTLVRVQQVSESGDPFSQSQDGSNEEIAGSKYVYHDASPSAIGDCDPGGNASESLYTYWRRVLYYWLQLPDPSHRLSQCPDASESPIMPSVRNARMNAPGAKDSSNTAATTRGNTMMAARGREDVCHPTLDEFMGYHLNSIFLSVLHIAEVDVNDWLFVVCTKSDVPSNTLDVDNVGSESPHLNSPVDVEGDDGFGSDGDDTASEGDEIDDSLTVGGMTMAASSITLASVRTSPPSAKASPLLPCISCHSNLIINTAPRLQPFFLPLPRHRPPSAVRPIGHIAHANLSVDDAWKHCIHSLHLSGPPATNSVSSSKPHVALSCMNSACVFIGDSYLQLLAAFERKLAPEPPSLNLAAHDPRAYLASVRELLLANQGVVSSTATTVAHVDAPMIETPLLSSPVTSSSASSNFGADEAHNTQWYRPEARSISSLTAGSSNQCALISALLLGLDTADGNKNSQRSLFEFRGSRSADSGESCARLFTKLRALKQLKCHNRIPVVCSWLRLSCTTAFKYCQLVQMANSTREGVDVVRNGGQRFDEFFTSDAARFDVVVDQESGETFIMTNTALAALTAPQTTQKLALCSAIVICIQASLRMKMSSNVAHQKQTANLERSTSMIQMFARSFRSHELARSLAAKQRVKLLTLLSLREDARRRLENALSPDQRGVWRRSQGLRQGHFDEDLGMDTDRNEAALRTAQRRYVQQKEAKHSPRIRPEDDLISLFSNDTGKRSPMRRRELSPGSDQPTIIELTPNEATLPRPQHFIGNDDADEDENDAAVMRALFGGGGSSKAASRTSYPSATPRTSALAGEFSAPPYGGVPGEDSIEDPLIFPAASSSSTSLANRPTSSSNGGVGEGLAIKLFDTTRLLRQQRYNQRNLSAAPSHTTAPSRRRFSSLDEHALNVTNTSETSIVNRVAHEHTTTLSATHRSSLNHISSLEFNYRVLIESEEASAFEAKFVKEVRILFPHSTLLRREAAAREKIVQSRSTEILMLFSMVFGAENCVIRKAIIAEEQAVRRVRLVNGADFVRFNTLTLAEKSARKEILLAESEAREIFTSATYESVESLHFLVWAHAEKANEKGDSTSAVAGLRADRGGLTTGGGGFNSSSRGSRAGSVGGKSMGQLTAATTVRRRKAEVDSKVAAAYASSSISALFRNAFTVVNNLHREEAKARKELVAKVCLPYLHIYEAYARRKVFAEWWHDLSTVQSEVRMDLLVKTEALTRRRLFFSAVIVSAEATARFNVENDENMGRELIQCVGYCKRRQVDLGQWSPSLTLLAQAELQDILPTESTNIFLGHANHISNLRKRTEATTQELLNGLKSERRNVMQMLRSVYEARSMSRRSDIDASSIRGDSTVADGEILPQSPPHLSREERNIATIFEDDSRQSVLSVGTSPTSAAPHTVRSTRSDSNNSSMSRPSNFLQNAFHRRQIERNREGAANVSYSRPSAYSEGGVHHTQTAGSSSMRAASSAVSLGGTYVNPVRVKQLLQQSAATGGTSSPHSPMNSPRTASALGSVMRAQPQLANNSTIYGRKASHQLPPRSVPPPPAALGGETYRR